MIPSVITQGPGPLKFNRRAEDGTLSQELNATDVDSGTSFTWSLTRSRHQWNRRDRFRHRIIYLFPGREL